jgi:ketosteroid isomerase-like protein
MKFWIACVLCLLSMGSVAQSQAPSGATEKTVLALEEQWLRAYQTNNIDSIADLLADKFIYTGNDGKIYTKTQMLADQRAMKFTEAENQDVQIAVFGNTAITRGGFKGKETSASGKAIDIHDRWTDVWVKMPSGKWQCVSSQDSRITP